MSNKIFDLEQSVLQCWNVCDDMDLLYSQTMNREKSFTPDEWANIFLGMKSLYHLKFQKCFSEFEDVCKEYHTYRKVYEAVQQAKDDGK